MRTIWRVDNGLAVTVEPVDAKEMLANSPDVWTDVDPNSSETEVLASISASNVKVISGQGPPTSYTDGTPPASGQGIAGAGRGSFYIDLTNDALYINVGSRTEPEWHESVDANVAVVLIAAAKAEAIAAASSDASIKATAAQAAATAAAISGQFSIVGTIGDLCEVIGAGAPDLTQQANLLVNPAGDDNALLFTAVNAGIGGNLLSVVYVDPAANDAALSVVVNAAIITVNLATDAGGVITSTAAEILAAVGLSGPASALVVATIEPSDTGAGDDGSGVVTAMASSFLVGGTGTAAGVAGPGSRYTDTTNCKLYINGGTKAVPDWKIVTSA